MARLSPFNPTPQRQYHNADGPGGSPINYGSGPPGRPAPGTFHPNVTDPSTYVPDPTAAQNSAWQAMHDASTAKTNAALQAAYNANPAWQQAVQSGNFGAAMAQQRAGQDANQKAAFVAQGGDPNNWATRFQQSWPTPTMANGQRGPGAPTTASVNAMPPPPQTTGNPGGMLSPQEQANLSMGAGGFGGIPGQISGGQGGQFGQMQQALNQANLQRMMQAAQMPYGQMMQQATGKPQGAPDYSNLGPQTTGNPGGGGGVSDLVGHIGPNTQWDMSGAQQYLQQGRPSPFNPPSYPPSGRQPIGPYNLPPMNLPPSQPPMGGQFQNPYMQQSPYSAPWQGNVGYDMSGMGMWGGGGGMGNFLGGGMASPYGGMQSSPYSMASPFMAQQNFGGFGGGMSSPFMGGGYPFMGPY